MQDYVELLRPSQQRKRDAFKKLAEKRTNAVLERIRILGNLANRGAYNFTDEDIRRVFVAIESELRLTRAKFAPSERRKFTLD
jgi:CHAD domain-containing protein